MPRGVDSRNASRAVDGIRRLRPVSIGAGRGPGLRNCLFALLCSVLVGQFIVSIANAEQAGSRAERINLAALDRDFAPADRGASDAPWASVIHDIQQILADLNLYNGPIDGRYTVAVKEAVHRFEKQYGRIGDGPALSEALSRMTSIRTALQLRDSLASVRRRGIDEAARALRGNAATRDLVDKVPAPPRSAQPLRRSAAQDCRAEPTVRCLLRQASVSLEAVQRDYYRDWALREIIVAEARTGQFESVRARIRQLSDPRLILVSLREYAEALAAHGQFDEAIRTAESIPEDENQIRALAAIAVLQAQAGDTVNARRLVEKVFSALESKSAMAGRVAIATSLASGLADAGDIVHARIAVALAQRIASPATTRLVQRVELGMITGALAETGQYREAMSILSELVQETPEPAVTMTASAISKATVAEAERYRVTTLCSLAIVQAKLGDRAAAAAILKKAKLAAGKVRRGYPAAYAHARIAEAWAAAGEFTTAEDMTAALAHPVLRAQGFWKVGAARAAAGDTAEAQRLERLALGETLKIPSLFDRTIVLGDSAASRARAGRGPEAKALLRRALELGHSIEDAWWRSRAFAHLARTLHVMKDAAPG